MLEKSERVRRVEYGGEGDYLIENFSEVQIFRKEPENDAYIKTMYLSLDN